jgi:hypothetical protein
MYDNFFLGHHSLSANVPQTNSEGTAGYAEGPGYMADLCTAFLPFVRAADNALPRWSYHNPLNPDNRYSNLLAWLQNITTNYGYLPTYDNTSSAANFLGVLGDSKFKSFASLVPSGTIDLRGDYLLAMGEEPETDNASGALVSPLSGDLILKNSHGQYSHYFHMDCETGS